MVRIFGGALGCVMPPAAALAAARTIAYQVLFVTVLPNVAFGVLCVLMCYALLDVFSRLFNGKPGPLTKGLNSAAYTVYLFHPYAMEALGPAVAAIERATSGRERLGEDPW